MCTGRKTPIGRCADPWYLDSPGNQGLRSHPRGFCETVTGNLRKFGPCGRGTPLPRSNPVWDPWSNGLPVYPVWDPGLTWDHLWYFLILSSCFLPSECFLHFLKCLLVLFCLLLGKLLLRDSIILSGFLLGL